MLLRLSVFIVSVMSLTVSAASLEDFWAISSFNSSLSMNSSLSGEFAPSAWRVNKSDVTTVSIMSSLGALHRYNCQGQSADCSMNEKVEKDAPSHISNLSFLRAGEEAALLKFKNYAKRRGIDYNQAMTSYTTWSTGPSLGHGDNDNVWVEINFGASRPMFLACHKHAHDHGHGHDGDHHHGEESEEHHAEDFVCHTQRASIDQPDFL